MLMSCLLAVAIAGSPSVRVAFLQPEQDATPAGAAVVPAPPSSENAQTDAGNSGTAGNEKKARDDEKKNNVDKHHTKKRASARHTRRKARVASRAADGEPRKVVVLQGGAAEPSAQIVPGLLPGEAAKQRQTAEEMLVSSEDRLKQLAGRSLDGTRQETVAQIRNYMEKARSALQEGDTQRGHTLALKAYLLADDLVKH
jgi:hypothetical protein